MNNRAKSGIQVQDDRSLADIRAEVCPDGSYWLHDDRKGTYTYRRAEDSWLPEGWSWRLQPCCSLPDDTDVECWAAWDDESDAQCWYDGTDCLKMDFSDGEHDDQVRDAVWRANKEIIKKTNDVWARHHAAEERHAAKAKDGYA